MIEHKNTILAIVLSLIVVVGWQYFIGYPQMEKQRREAELKQQEQAQLQPGPPSTVARRRRRKPALRRCRVRLPAPRQQPDHAREAVVAASPRVAIDTPRLNGSIDLKGGAHRQSLARAISRDDRSEFAADRAAFSVGIARGLLCGVRLGAGVRHDRENAGSGYGLDAGPAAARSGVDHPITLTYDNGAGLTVPPHHRGRRPLSVHDQG